MDNTFSLYARIPDASSDFFGFHVNDKREKIFYNNFLKSWNTVDDPEMMLMMCESNKKEVVKKTREIAYKILSIAINSLKEDEYYLNCLDYMRMIRKVLDGEINELSYEVYLFQQSKNKIGLRWGAIYTCITNFFCSTSIIPTQCILFFDNNKIKYTERMSSSDMAEMIRSAITPMEVIDRYVFPG